MAKEITFRSVVPETAEAPKRTSIPIAAAITIFPARPLCFSPVLPLTPSYEISRKIATSHIPTLTITSSSITESDSFITPIMRNNTDKINDALIALVASLRVRRPERRGLSGLFDLSVSISVMSL